MEAVCPILGRSTQVKPTKYSLDPWTIVQCQETGFVFLKDPPSYDRLEEEFAWEKTSANQTERRRRRHPITSALSLSFSHFKNWLHPRRNRFYDLTLNHASDHLREGPLRVLDIGCGSGHLLKDFHERFSLANRQVIPSGIEVSLELARQATECVSPYGGGIIQKDAVNGSSDLPVESVEVVIMSSFLEHECQPLKLLQGLHRALVADGAIVLKVPNFACINRHLRQHNWPGFRYPDHVNYFTPATLTRLASEAGYDCRQTLKDKLPTSDSMYAVLTKKQGISANVTQRQAA